jgi:RNA recognition motif-containing protein
MTNIYVGNLSYEATEDDLRQAFQAHGEVTSVAIIKDKMTGRSRGFGFVEMSDKNQAEAAIQALNLQEVRGRAITVNEAKPKSEGAPRGGGGGGRGGFGGGRGRREY